MTEAKELATVEPERRSSGILDLVAQAATNKDVDASKMEQMANLALRLRDDEQKQEFNRSLQAAMAEMPRISRRNEIIIPGKDGKPSRVQGKFASYENIDAVVRPILDRHGLAIRFKVGNDGSAAVLVTPILSHRNGYTEVGDTLRVPNDTSGSKNAAQAVGSSLQYAKRYALCAALNIVTEGEDRDGTSYPLADDPLNDRQERLVAEAEASHADGNYEIWFKKQTVQDRNWLVIRGIHARLTGAPALPSGRTVEDIEDAQIEHVDEDGVVTNQPPPAEPETKGKRTVRQMADDYLAKVEACKTEDELLDLQQDPKTQKWLEGVRAKDRAIFDDITTKSSTKYSSLLAGQSGEKLL